MRESEPRGFTLIELMIVLGIAGVLTVFVGWGMGSMTNRLGVQNESIKFRDALLRARNLAVVSGQCVTVSITAQQVTVTSFAPTPACAPPFGAATSTTVTNFNATTTLQPFSTGDPLVFNTNGGTIYALPSTMSLTGPDRGFTYNIYPAIGQIRFQ